MPSNVDRPPGKIDIPSAWRGEALADNSGRWLTVLEPGDVAELENAAKSYLAAGGKIAEITKQRFPLPGFGAHLEKLKTTLKNGLGFEVIRGLPVANYSQEFAATIFCGVGAHLGF